MENFKLLGDAPKMMLSLNKVMFDTLTKKGCIVMTNPFLCKINGDDYFAMTVNDAIVIYGNEDNILCAVVDNPSVILLDIPVARMKTDFIASINAILGFFFTSKNEVNEAVILSNDPQTYADLNIQNTNYAQVYKKIDKLGIGVVYNALLPAFTDENMNASKAMRVNAVVTGDDYSTISSVFRANDVSFLLTVWARLMPVLDAVPEDDWSDIKICEYKVNISSPVNIANGVPSSATGEYDAEGACDTDDMSRWDINVIDTANSEKYTEDLDDLTAVVKDMCRYVKTGVKGPRFKKGIIISGTSGASKTYTVKDLLRTYGMVDGKDFHIKSSGSSKESTMYNLMYKYNGKIIVLDDAAGIFDGEQRMAMWKAACDITEDPNPLSFGDGVAGDSVYYDPSKMNRLERYYKEAGIELSDKEVPDGTDAAGNTIYKTIQVRKKAKPAVPNTFIFTGCVIVLSNLPLDELLPAKSNPKTRDNRNAIDQRFLVIRMNPDAKSQWRLIKDIILAQKNNESLTEQQRLIPKSHADAFIEFVEGLYGPEYSVITFRLATEAGLIIKRGMAVGEEEIAEAAWRRESKNKMRTDTSN